ncbi:hypothetical protein [Nonomuraea sp. NPDC005501]|uniref:hypothetical protein n=1 Tax=Nonomuraea sp. NPDC005501 TaxID=3156884 RepID=UPI0033B57D2B
MAPGTQIHVTSEAILYIRGRVDKELKGHVEFLRSLAGTLDVDGAGFGLCGEWVLGDTYRGVCRQADEVLLQAEQAVESWVEALTVCERNWRAAEDHSIVKSR